MATDWPLKVYIDTANPRPDIGRIVIAADGTCWDKAASDSTIFFDAVTNTAMLMPLSLTPEFETTFTGDYERFPASNLSFPTPAKWVTNQVRGQYDYWHESLGVNEVVQSRNSAAPNQPIYIGAYVDGVKGSSDRVVLEGGWGYGTAQEVKVQLLASGQYRVWKSGTQVGQYAPGADAKDTKRTAYNTSSSRGQFHAMTLVPCRYRDLLIIDANGSAICHTFKDLAPPDGSGPSFQVITPSAPIYFYASNGKAVVQLYQVRFKTSGNLYGPVTRTRFALPSGWSYSVNDLGYHTMGLGTSGSRTITLVNADGSALTLNGTQDQVRLKVAMSASTAFDGIGVYFADAYSNTSSVNTSNTNVDITTKVESLECSVGEDGRVQVTMTARKKMLTDAGVNRPHIIANRAFAIRLSNGTTEQDLVRGQFDAPDIEYFERDDSANSDWALLTFRGQDYMGLLDRIWFRDVIAYDNTPIAYILEDLLCEGGFDCTTQVDYDSDFTPAATTIDASLDKWSLLPDRGDTIGKWIDKLHQEYAPLWIRGFGPPIGSFAETYVFRWRDPATVSVIPKVTLYQSISTATTAGVAEALRPKRVIRRLTEVYERPEANQVQVLGQDPHTGELLWATMNDDASQDPSLAPSARPENWLGTTEPFLYQDPAIHSLPAVGYIALQMAGRLMPGRTVVEWESDLLVDSTTDVQLWLGDIVRIMQPDGTTTKGDYQIVAIPSITFVDEGDGSRFRTRNVRYKAIKLRTQSLVGSDANNSGMFGFPR